MQRKSKQQLQMYRKSKQQLQMQIKSKQQLQKQRKSKQQMQIQRKSKQQFQMQRKSKRILCSIIFLKNRAVYEIMLKIFVDSDRPQMTIWFKRNSHWINEATNAQSEYVIAFSLLFHCNYVRKNAPQCYVVRTLSVLLYSYVLLLVTLLRIRKVI